MLTTQFVPGAPTWLDLGAPDVKAAAAFYTGVFGWSFQSAGPQGGDYGFLQLDGKTVAALGPLTEEGARPAWTTYFATADADATAALVERHGGEVRAAPSDVFTKGRMAHFTDPAGAEFAVWQARDLGGLDLVTEPGSLGWVELHVQDAEEVLPFYQAVFGWRAQSVAMGPMTYRILSTGESEDTSFGGLTELMPDDRPHWAPYFEVSDCDGTVAMAQQLGGTLVAPAESVEGVGRFATLDDPFGARFSVITSTP
ncbi:VOC family protein [Nonomuraea africana]|uniref:Enzyme related to lactoylglutathione lyase n=1 Tax=Nonomuraea africana TaxID=46171 RepID=A0ABR9KG99_9ACTN|nr:VOC family protein [Nonomuraea africana]MBE1561054.1 putative enzyme related to lactoylglutathione lyase [Nonomuraea africana]